jgi:Flp pilus assembly protein TadG
MAEFALSASLVLAVMFGILDFGRAMYDYTLVANAARLGVRQAIVHAALTQSDIDAIVASVQAQSPGIDVTKLSISITPSSASSSINCYSPPYNASCNVVVTASYPFSFVAFPAFATLTMTSTSEMPISY